MTSPVSKEQWAEARRLSPTRSSNQMAPARRVLLALFSSEPSRFSKARARAVREEVATDWADLGLRRLCRFLRAARSRAAGGMDIHVYLLLSQEMTRVHRRLRHVGPRFSRPRCRWRSSFSTTATRKASAIQAFRIKFSSGFEIVGLSSAPRTLRGKKAW